MKRAIFAVIVIAVLAAGVVLAEEDGAPPAHTIDINGSIESASSSDQTPTVDITPIASGSDE